MNRTGQPGRSSDDSTAQSDPLLSIGKPMSKQKKQQRELNRGSIEVGETALHRGRHS
jgi:hypothetical protein